MMFVRSDRGTQIQTGVKVVREVVRKVVREVCRKVLRKVVRNVVREVVTKAGKWTERRKPPQGEGKTEAVKEITRSLNCLYNHVLIQTLLK